MHPIVLSKPYCLRCYASLSSKRATSRRCKRCGENNLEVDRLMRWTREERFVLLERLLKFAVVFAMVLVAAVALLSPGIGSGKGHGMAIGAPILVGVLLWDVAGLTRKRSQFRADIVWPIIGWFLGLPAAGLFWALYSNERAGAGALWLLGFSVALTLPAILSPRIRRRWASWRESYVEARRLAAVESAAADAVD